MAGRPSAGDHVGHGEGLARAGHAQQRLVGQAVLHAFHQLLDRRGLVARRRIGLEQLERRIRKADEFARRHAVCGRLTSAMAVMLPGHGQHLESSGLAAHPARGATRQRSADRPVFASFAARLTPAQQDRPCPPRLFTAVEMAPRDPILGLNEQFNADPNPAKVNLGVGVYFDDNGKLPLLQAAWPPPKSSCWPPPRPRGYLPIDGIAAYDKAVQGLVFGADSEAVKAGRVATVQALGGTGGLKVGADFLKRSTPPPRC
jgi:hypothetical protein